MIWLETGKFVNVLNDWTDFEVYYYDDGIMEFVANVNSSVVDFVL